MPDATPQQIKKAYYNCMKACHPDLSGNDPDVTNFCMFINEVYTVKFPRNENRTLFSSGDTNNLRCNLIDEVNNMSKG